MKATSAGPTKRLPKLTAPSHIVDLAGAIVRVGSGRGFPVQSPRLDTLVITAGHCLPDLPPAMPAAHNAERTYVNFIGPIGGAATLAAECLFVDPVGDLAVLCGPDNQTYFDESEQYEAFTDRRPKLTIGRIPEDPCQAWLLARDGKWCSCSISVGRWGRTLQISDLQAKSIAPGTSGSPVITAAGVAVGVVSIGEYLNPVLVNHLPGWLLSDLVPARVTG